MLESIPGQVFVVSVVIIISIIAFSSQIFLFFPAYDGWSYASFITLGPLNLLVGMVYYNYYLAVVTDPGKIPSYWEPPASIVSNIKENLAEGITGPRFCKACTVYKPPRSHHCRYCNRCVLRMDHHCPWINNCVGNNNYAHFIRFIIYADIACIYVFVLLIGRVKAIMNAIRHFQFDAEPDTIQVVFMVLNFIMVFIVLFCVGILTIYQLYCMCRNQTNIESWERGKVNKLVKKRKIPPVNYPFDIGYYRNICEIMGHNPLLWLWPKECESDGLVFPVIPETDPRLPYYWPPRDPDDLRPSIFSSKYRRQKEVEKRLREDPDAIIEESDEYYDSGSFVTDSENEYSIEDEEESMKYSLSNRNDPSYPRYAHDSNYYRNSTESSEDDDKIPLSAVTSRRKTISKQD
ncbi:DHHC palmitoyltransferase-domain-containing protein [Pilobolus umbonatus]|nr:DHHC palmitoyltransferase-domain-containing protein [Pilobolus umbonatus]